MAVKGCLNGRLMMTNDARTYASVYLLLFSRRVGFILCIFANMLRSLSSKLASFDAAVSVSETRVYKQLNIVKVSLWNDATTGG